ncbi:MAG: hypothetical protein AMJ46_14150 [Latescibacteria bacterium DG_63]|nr:MAG: hypothetical protein AMJ46_14150 [Latescibacteria bacterium DG_63]
MNGCPRKLNEIGISGAAGCNALGEVEYHASFDGTQSIAGVSNSVSIVGGAKYRIYTEGYDFCLIRTDDSQGPRACGADGFLATWIDSVLAWSGFDPSIVCCPPGEPPIPPEATVEWRNLVCDDSRAFVCPACSLVPPGDTCLASWIYVRTTDWFGAPYSGLEIYTQFDATCDMCLCAPVSAVTDDNGEAFLYIRAGLDRAASATCCSVKTRVMCLGVTLFESTKPWLSPDMNADSVVDIDDTIILAGDWLTSACRSDFNCDGIVDSSDWAIFAAHYGHACEPTLVAVGEGLEPRPARRELTQNYPNPFNPYTKITFSLTKPGRVVLRIYSIAGRTVRTLVDAHREPGSYSELWDGRAEDGRELPSGVYFYRLEAGEFMATRKMVLLK